LLIRFSLIMLILVAIVKGRAWSGGGGQKSRDRRGRKGLRKFCEKF